MSGMEYRSMSDGRCRSMEDECLRSTVVSEYRSTGLVSWSIVVERNRATNRPVGRLERLVDESHSVVFSEASSRDFIAPFGRCVAGKVLEYFRLRPISRGYSGPD
ncbi:hypothetical protein F2Q69_00053056 [Brassica cretica]|uniref:Uncharacterized protein n=1 Tax=Brassica cretica TaxID=69181 RepID=A0A8S9MX83_BRACR|nr:hypothetical protein F2Q69_00053056 [Brassica cretica]